MAESRKRRPILKRILVWMAASVMFLVLYFGSAPIAGYLIAQRIPALAPVVYVAYYPTEHYCQHSELPGSDAYRAYGYWCQQALGPLAP